MVLVLVPPSGALPGQTIPLDNDEQHHLKVRRISAGTEVGFIDGLGHRGNGRLVSSGRELALEVAVVEWVARPVPLALAVGAGDRDRMGWVVEKATELGVTDLIPLETERTQGVATKVKASHLDGFRRRSREALKQCDSAWAVQVHELEPLANFLARPVAGLRWLLDADGEAASTLDAAAPVTALVGPEGGLDPSERSLALEQGFRPVRAGPHVLRFETAAIVAAALIQSARR